MDVDLDKEFLQELKELKILITDKDLLDQHKRQRWRTERACLLITYFNFHAHLIPVLCFCSVWCVQL